MNMQTINAKKYHPLLYGFFPKLTSSSILFLILGFLTPWPLFFFASDLSFIFLDFDVNQETWTLDGTPVPIGLITLSIYIFLVMIRTRSAFFLFRSIFVYSLVMFPLLMGFDLIRIPVLLFPILFLIILKRISAKRYEPNDGFAFGYLIGLITVYLTNILSWLLLSFLSQDFGYIYYSRQIFGYEIWQYLVSYSAIASLVFGVFTIFLVNNYRILSKVRIYFILLSISSLIASLLPLRKAAFLDIAFFLIIILLGFIPSLVSLKISKTKLIYFVLASIGLLAFSLVMNNMREIGLDSAAEARLPAISLAFSLVDSDIYSFLFGYNKGFGDYSNLFVELFIRNGLLGTFAYFGVLSYSFNRYLKSFILIKSLPDFKNYSVIWFVVFSVLIGNIVNLNFSLPYFVVNLAAIMLCIQYFDFSSRLNLSKYLN
tara:strand:- start:5823 stop:7109 length:1287 start_codon:yes stop_codon:yes gene_type:complete